MKSTRGFASIKDPQKRKELAAIGGKAAHAKGKAYEWDPQSGAIAGSKGGKVKEKEMTRELAKRIRQDAFNHAKLMDLATLREAIADREKKIKELDESARYHAAHLVGYRAALKGEK